MSVKVAKVTSATAMARAFLNDIATKARRHETHTVQRTLRAFVLSWLTFLQQQAPERRDDEAHRLVEAVRGDRLGVDAAAVADVAAAVERRVAVEQLGVPPRFRHANPILH